MASAIVALAGALAQASTFAATVPLLPHGATPRIVRAVLALWLAPLLAIASPHPDAGSLVTTLIERGVAGAAFGLGAAVVAGAVTAAGDLIDTALGSPPFLVRSAVGGPVARLYQIAFAATLLHSGGLTSLIGRFALAGTSLPHHLLSWRGLGALANASLGASLALAGPSLLAQALATLVAGMLARATPQLNGMLFSGSLASGSVLLALAAGAIALRSELATVVRQTVVLATGAWQ